ARNAPRAGRAGRVAAWWAAPQGPRPGLVAMYFEMVDGAGHDHGPGSEQARAAIRTVDAAIGQLLARLEAAGVVPNVVVVSDHGMADARNFLAVEDIAAMEEAEVVSIGHVIGLVPRAGYGDVLRARLPGRHAQYQCWEKERIPARVHYGSQPRNPPAVCQMDGGWHAQPRTVSETRKAEGHRDGRARLRPGPSVDARGVPGPWTGVPPRPAPAGVRQRRRLPAAGAPGGRAAAAGRRQPANPAAGAAGALIRGAAGGRAVPAASAL